MKGLAAAGPSLISLRPMGGRRLTTSDYRFETMPPVEWPQIIRALLKEDGLVAVQKARGSFMQFESKVRGPFSSEILTIVRIYTEAISQEDVDDAATVARERCAGSMAILQTKLPDRLLRAPQGVTLVSPQALKRALSESSFLISNDGKPELSYPEIDFAADWGSSFNAIANSTLRWLPALSRNKKPIELRDTGVSADRLFERAFFKVATEVFQLRGQSWGEQEAFTAKPDGWLAWPGGGAIYDCKAAGAGYRMSSIDWRKFRDYALDETQSLGKQGEAISHVLVVSSSFPGGPGQRHAAYGRARSLVDQTGLKLAYVKTLDLVAIGREMESRKMTTDQRRSIDWSTGLETITTLDGLRAALTGNSV